MNWLPDRLSSDASLTRSHAERVFEIFVFLAIASLLAMLVAPSIKDFANRGDEQPYQDTLKSVQRASSQEVAVSPETSDQFYLQTSPNSDKLPPDSEVVGMRVRKPVYRAGELLGSLSIWIDESSNLHLELAELKQIFSEDRQTFPGLEQLPPTGQVSFALLRDFGVNIQYDTGSDALSID